MLLLTLLMVLTAIGGASLVIFGGVDVSDIPAMVQGTGLVGMVSYIAITVILHIMWIPRSWTILGACALFGSVPGVLLSFLADTVSALVCYWIARTMGRSWVERQLMRRPRAAKLVEILGRRRGGVTIALLRSTPVAHYTLTSYAAGLANMPWKRYLVGNTCGLPPGAIVYAVAGATVMNPGSPWFIATVVLLVLAVVISGIVGRIVWRRINESEPRGAERLIGD